MLPSPCINICRMNPDGKLCTGCLRSLDEITAWASADDALRSTILAAVARRWRQTELPNTLNRSNHG